VRILIDVLHPAHVHFFRHFRAQMLDRGHEVLVTARDKDVAIELLNEFGIPYEVLSRQRSGTVGLAAELVERSARLLRVARRFRPDVLTGIMGPVIAPVGRLIRVPAVVFYDTEWASRTNRFVYPLAACVCTPDSYTGAVNGTHVTYPGYHELAYLHPDLFTADEGRLAEYGLERPFVLVRFVSWKASHDVGGGALEPDSKLELVRRLQARTRVAISAEGELPAELEPLRLRGPISGIHHVLAAAELVVGDSGTMSSEAAVLGTPAVFISPMRAGVHEDQERYGLMARSLPSEFDRAWDAVTRYLEDGSAAASHRRMLDDKINVADWMVRFFESRAFERSTAAADDPTAFDPGPGPGPRRGEP
jgi:predicted glycosyltransferase